eukprot:Amastigsp_a2395_132.p3 type:complete len:114 gc:universal Amastigsp_a2395_132:541-200(-)
MCSTLSRTLPSSSELLPISGEEVKHAKAIVQCAGVSAPGGDGSAGACWRAHADDEGPLDSNGIETATALPHATPVWFPVPCKPLAARAQLVDAAARAAQSAETGESLRPAAAR